MQFVCGKQAREKTSVCLVFVFMHVKLFQTVRRTNIKVCCSLFQVIQLQGDQRKNVQTFLIQEKIVKNKDLIKIHGF